MVKETKNMFELKIIPYDKGTPPYRDGFYYCMCLDHHLTFSYNLVDVSFFHMKRFKVFFDDLHKDKKINKWLAEFSRKTHEISHKSRNF